MKKEKKFPKISLCILGLIILASVFAGLIAPYSVEEMNPEAVNLAPSAGHVFGTDSMGRDLFTMVLYGGRASIYIGLFSACISTMVAVVYGTLSGLAGERIDERSFDFAGHLPAGDVGEGFLYVAVGHHRTDWLDEHF